MKPTHTQLFKFFVMAMLVIIGMAYLGACGIQPQATSDSDQSYAMGAYIPVDDNVYTITGEVVAEQRSDKTISASGYGYVGTYYGSSSYSMWTEGKGFVRIKVNSATPATNQAEPGSVYIFKTTDRKVIGLLPGDTVELKCRVQFEAIAAVREGEIFDANKLGTWEVDYCRMTSGRINVNE